MRQEISLRLKCFCCYLVYMCVGVQVCTGQELEIRSTSSQGSHFVDATTARTPRYAVLRVPFRLEYT
jgi:hypothetical protein